ncbi:hypothetical protein [Chryseobacterium sp. WX]|uniref:hypothetical protein n=1 Tax=Chryseobacterium sp. WX TaxID=3031803 RepID=UPI00240A6BA4|nr:hypothetical protein [Chryseobacterium sp. WX]WFB67053.1 hypothetical protein PZ898_20415 [Chryseobacterium sp. WX]
MKQLEITTNKRLLIVELPNSDCEYGGLLKNRNLYFFTEKMSSEEDYPVCYPLPYDCEFICKGPDFTEDIAKGFVEYKQSKYYDREYYWDYKNKRYSISESSIKSFISAIQSKNYHWGENPVKEPRMSDYGWYASGHPEEDSGRMYEDGEDKYYESLKLFEESESRTFNPSKCIIFEIV